MPVDGSPPKKVPDAFSDQDLAARGKLIFGEAERVEDAPFR